MAMKNIMCVFVRQDNAVSCSSAWSEMCTKHLSRINWGGKTRKVKRRYDLKNANDNLLVSAMLLHVQASHYNAASLD